MEKWIVFALISMLFAGVTSVIAKFGMKDLSSDTALAFRTTVVFSIVITYAFIMRNAWSELQQTSTNNLMFLAISGITTSLSWIFYYHAIKAGPVSYVATIDKASILVTLVLSVIILHEPVTPKLLVGSAFILIGLIILIWK